MGRRDWWNRSRKWCVCGGHSSSDTKKNKHHNSTKRRLWYRQRRRRKIMLELPYPLYIGPIWGILDTVDPVPEIDNLIRVLREKEWKEDEQGGGE